MAMHHLHEALAQGTVSEDEAHGRIGGWLPGIVTDIDTKLMQIKARLGKQGDNESTEWIPQAGMGGIESLPEVGDPVGVFFEDGDVHRGAYFCFPQSNTKGRPKEAIVLGSTFIAMYNDLVAKFNNLKSVFNSHTHGYIDSKGTAATPTPSVTVSPNHAVTSLGVEVPGPAADTDADTGSGKSSDGSTVAQKASSAVVLSKRSRVR